MSTAPTPATQTSLADWLLARLDEDEAAARAASRGPWSAVGPYVSLGAARPTGTPALDALGSTDAAHIARHDPARVLADVAARRAVLDYFEHGDDIVLYRVLQLLAAPYSDAPGYDEQWRL